MAIPRELARREVAKGAAGNPGGAARRPTIIEALRAHGIVRSGTPKRGFRFRAPDGRRITQADRDRIDALRIPPAWSDVAISLSDRSPVQAVGRDAAGRWQYLYHRRHVARRERDKQRRLMRFLLALPAMRQAVSRDLARPGLPRERVLAAILTVLGTCFLRSGGEEYADQNGSYGIATLQRRHVSVQKDRVSFDFAGKSRRRQQHELRNRRVATVVRSLLKHPGEVFKFRTSEGALVDVRQHHINEYIREVMGERFSAKDFRTWAANLLCACVLARAAAERGATPRERKRQVTAAVREVSQYLGNTPAVCRASYIFDCVLAGYEEGRVIRSACEPPAALFTGSLRRLERTERALVSLLRNGRAAATAA